MQKLIGTLLVMFLGLVEAHGATLCLAAPEDVPENPSFIVARERLADGFRVTAHRDKDAPPFAYRVEILDDYFARVTVDARPGVELADPGFVGRGCKRTFFRVVEDWAPGALSWTRIDWAFTEVDLANGLHGSIMTRDNKHLGPSYHTLASQAGTRAVFVRTVRYLPDGTTSAWHGWFDPNAAELRLSPGSPPVDTAPRAACTSAQPPSTACASTRALVIVLMLIGGLGVLALIGRPRCGAP